MRMIPQAEAVGAGRGRENAGLLWLCVAAALGSAASFPFDHELSAFAVKFEPTQPLADGLFTLIKAFGKADVLIVLLLSACLTRLRRPAVHGLISLALIAAPVLLLKVLVDRDRPAHSGDSFPSGDTASVVAALVPMAVASRALLVPAVVLAVLVASFRVVAGWHFPSDVLAGAAFGLLAVWSALRFAPRRFLRPRLRLVLPLLLMALAGCGFVATTGSGDSPSEKFAIYVLPFVVIGVILERRRLARMAKGKAIGEHSR